MNIKCNNNADRNGTSLQGYITLSFADLVATFGQPEESDGYKVSTEWTFEADNGQVFALYDYKDTNLYDKGLPSVEQFRALRSFEWHIGANGNSDIEAFKAAVVAAIAKRKSGMSILDLRRDKLSDLQTDLKAYDNECLTIEEEMERLKWRLHALKESRELTQDNIFCVMEEIELLNKVASK